MTARFAGKLGRCLLLLSAVAAIAGIVSADSPPPGARITDDGWFAPPKLAADRPVRPAEPKNVFIIPIREGISAKTLDTLRRKIDQCRARQADLIIFDMDTWGGLLIEALDIARIIKTDLHDIYTICYVRTRAVSAGALIAISCDEIIMTPETGSLGDCAPISLTGQEIGEVEREKLESETRREFRESADRNGYPAALAQSMVTITLEVWLARNKKTGELKYVLVEPAKDDKQELPEITETLPDKKNWEPVRVIVKSGELLTAYSNEAVEYGFASAIVKSPTDAPYSELQKHLNIKGEVTILSDTWSEKLVEFLSSPIVTGILFFLGIMGIYIEFHTPGFGLPGILGIVCFAILFGSRYLTGMANWWEIALFIVGVVLLFVEIFITPGFGAMGISGIICCIVAMLAVLVANPPDEIPLPQTDFAWDMFKSGLFYLLSGAIGAIIAAALLAKYLPKLPIAGKLVLAAAQAADAPPVSETSPVLKIRPGDIGVVESMCRPIGKARFNKDLLDVTTEGEYIQPGCRVRVLRCDGNSIFVEKIETTGNA